MLGGKARARDVYEEVTKLFPQLTEADLSETLTTGSNRWTNRIQWARQALVSKGELASAAHGVWSITTKGRARILSTNAPTTAAKRSEGEDMDAAPSSVALDGEAHLAALAYAQSPNLEDVTEEYVASFKQKVLNKLLDLSPSQFEQFAAALLKAFGFSGISVTGKTGDGGIDGHGQLRVGLAAIRAAFQCKRWQNSVGSKEVQELRGAIQGQFEQGYFFTTSTFTRSAQQESIKMGAVPVILFEGEQIVEIMIDKGVGVRRRPVEVYEDQLEQLFES